MQVGNWLTTIGFAEYRDVFLENDIHGSHLLDLTKVCLVCLVQHSYLTIEAQDDLKELVDRLGHRMSIAKAIERLQESDVNC